MNKRKKIEQYFRNILEIIEQQRPGYIAAMGEGVSDEIIRDCIKNHPIPEDLMAIYSCVRGSSSSVMFFGDSKKSSKKRVFTYSTGKVLMKTRKNPIVCSLNMYKIK